jgi:hypothetical protein
MILSTETDTNGITYEVHEEPFRSDFGRGWDYYTAATAGEYRGESPSKRVFCFQHPNTVDFEALKVQARTDLFLKMAPAINTFWNQLLARAIVQDTLVA